METATARQLDDEPEITDVKAPKAQKEAPKAESLSDLKAPIFRAADKVKQTAINTSNRIKATTGKLDAGMQKVLRFEDPGDAEKVSLLKTPIYTAGDAIDGTALNAGRRVWEMTNSVGSSARAAIRSVKRPILNPFNTIAHPIKYSTNLGRFLTSSARVMSNGFNAIPRALDEFGTRAIQRPLQRIGQKIPLIGGIISSVGKGIGWLTKKPRQLTEWITSPIERADSWMAKKQN